MNLKEKIRVIPDFPKEGISFKDITTLLKDGAAFRHAIKELAELVRDKDIDVIVCPEARGFVVGAPLAYELGCGLVPLRKPGKLPAEVLQWQYQLEYGLDHLEIHRDAIGPGQRVLICDDLLATGGTVSAAIRMVEELGGEIVGTAFLIELTELGGREKLQNYDIISLVQYNY